MSAGRGRRFSEASERNTSPSQDFQLRFVRNSDRETLLFARNRNFAAISSSVDRFERLPFMVKGWEKEDSHSWKLSKRFSAISENEVEPSIVLNSLKLDSIGVA